MDKHFTQFSVKLLLLLGVAFGIHVIILNFLNLDVYDNSIVKAYILNGVITLILYLVLSRLPASLKGNMGFIFMGGSLLKFVIFFLVFYPAYQEDNKMDRMEFFAFFTPYSISLFWETFALLRRLNKD